MKNNKGTTYSDKKIKILNGGDLSIDYHIQKNIELRKNYIYIVDSRGKTFLQVGNAAFTGALLREIYPQSDPQSPEIIDIFDKLKATNSMILPNSFSIVRKFETDKTDKEELESAWRVAEYLHQTKISKERFSEEFYNNDKNDSEADIVILSDYNQQFRRNDNIWPRLINERTIPPTFLRSCYPYNSKESRLLNSLLKKPNANKNLIIVTSIDDLRRCSVKISQGLSWERTALDLVDAFENQLSFFQRAAFVIIPISRFGVLLRQNNISKRERYHLYYLNKEIEEINDMGSMGSLHGLNTGVMIHVVKEYVDHFRKQGKITFTTVEKGIENGLRGITNAFNHGFSRMEKVSEASEDLEKLHFPADELLQTSSGKRFSHVKIPFSSEKHGNWNICCEELNRQNEKIFDNIVISGNIEEILHKIPYSRFGDLIIVGKRELEESRAIKKLVTSYIQKGDQKKPLSIAVFGDPGSGKSLTIKKITESIIHSEKTTLQFNLSQLTDVHALSESFHQIRDAKIDGKTVLVFWDEFDTFFENEDFGWVKYFLAPMQDGIFYGGSSTHTIGQSIFFFISSKYNSLKEITDIIENKSPASNNACTKLKDFTSRLQGHLEISGINPKGKDRSITPELKLRRAILLRVLLEKHCPSIFKEGTAWIDTNLLHTFINIKKYNFEARSMEAIITMSHLDGKSYFSQSCLPANNQLGLHVDEEKFLQLLNSER